MTSSIYLLFFFNDTATTEIYTLSLHDALPICAILGLIGPNGSGKTTLFNVITGVYRVAGGRAQFGGQDLTGMTPQRSEEHTSELQSQSNLVCRLLLEKKKISPYDDLSIAFHRS